MQTTEFIKTSAKPTAGKSARRTAAKPRAGQTVHFELINPSASKVCVAGTFNDWRPDAGEMVRVDDGKWVKELALAPGTYEYRLVVDGKWMPDPQANHGVVNPFGEKNSLLTVL
ncbi:MAG TPA: glycogen-binding domain-containing protein [Candidatus Sulfopaludibacter sp.]|nr:glycogen-binding domain-containing protein [Candidatus Sulfopaludibacter sp.]